MLRGIYYVNIKIYKNNLLIYLREPFFDTTTGQRPNLHACADRDETGSHQKKMAHPTPGGLGGYLLMFVGCVMRVGLWDDVCGMCVAFFDTTVGPRPNLARMCG